jgi:ubiquinone/menaquinone biosynthesis C-methylase UbiE
MDDSYYRNLQVWPASALATATGGTATPPSIRPFAGPHNPGEFAERLYKNETLNSESPPRRLPDGAEPYTLQWFLEIETQRHGRQGRWIPRLLEFAKHSGETLLGLGTGLGTDWLQYARHGASVVVCSPAAEQLALVRRNFELRGLAGRFLTARATSLPLETASIDVACVSGLLDEVAEPNVVIDEVYRVLKPGGKVLAVVPARYDVDYWSRVLLPWSRWLRSHDRRNEAGRFSARRLHHMFGRFVEHRTYKRQLRRSEVPHLWRWAPLPFLERMMGRVLVVKAFKPLSAAISVSLAA